MRKIAARNLNRGPAAKEATNHMSLPSPLLSAMLSLPSPRFVRGNSFPLVHRGRRGFCNRFEAFVIKPYARFHIQAGGFRLWLCGKFAAHNSARSLCLDMCGFFVFSSRAEAGSGQSLTAREEWMLQGQFVHLARRRRKMTEKWPPPPSGGMDGRTNEGVIGV